MPTTGIQALWWFFSIVFIVLILGLLLHMIKGWFDSVKTLFQGLKDEVEKMSAKITKLFERSEEDRLGIKDCQRHAAETYATKEDLKVIERQVGILFQRRDVVSQHKESRN